MSSGLFAKLAVVNIKKNSQTYIPYILACLFDVAMLYMMVFINNNAGMKQIRHSEDVLTISSMGVGVIIIFSFIFFYTATVSNEKKTKRTGALQHSRIGKEAYQYGYGTGNSDQFCNQLCGRHFGRNSGKQAGTFTAFEADQGTGGFWL